MMTTPNTQPEIKAFQFPEVRVVEASAGSGKTYALARRYIQLLLNPSLPLEKIPIRNILAITFTNKAAFEMKARILEFLKAIALGRISALQQQDILAPIGLDAATASKKAFRIMEDLIHNYNFFQVQTIDKFINALLSGCAFKIGLTANFKIRTDSDEYLRYSLDELIDRIGQQTDIRQSFERFVHNYLYLENRTGWFPKEDMLSIIGALFVQYNTYGLNFSLGPFSMEEVIVTKKVLLEDIKELSQNLPEKTDQRFLKSLQAFLKDHRSGFDIDAISDYFARQEFPALKGGEVTRTIDRLWEKIRVNLERLCEQEAYSLFNPYIVIFNQVLEGFYRKAAKDDVLFLSELNKRAGVLFDEDYVTVEELYYRLATRFRHYLIDEFQDTSRLQWHNLRKMAEEALSTGGTLFYVGDRKQAIYGFRGGEAELFDQIKEEFQPFNVRAEALTNNWRSQRAIVEFNNAVFSIENLKEMIAKKQEYEGERNSRSTILFNEKDMNEIENIFCSSKQSFCQDKQGGCVRVEYVDIDTKSERDEFIRERLIRIIEDLRQRFAMEDIAILARSNTQVELLTNWLLEENIQVFSERTSNIKESAVISELVVLLKFLDSPIDNLSFAAFILGDVFSQATGLRHEDLHQFVFGLRDRLTKEKGFYLYTEFRDVYGTIWEGYFQEFFQNIGLYPLYEMVVSIYNRFGCLKNFPESQGFLMHFLELVKKNEEDHADVVSFLEYFDQLVGEGLYVNVVNRDAIKIITIHKSKGLQFPVVILPFLGMDIQIGNQQEYQQSYILKRNDKTMQLLRLKKKYLRFSEHLHSLYHAEYKGAFISELNSIYVALTRPRHELYCLIPKRVQNKFNFVKFLIPEDVYESGQPVGRQGAKKEDPLPQPLSPSQYYDWIGFLKDEFQPFDMLKARKQRLKGEVIHFMLALIGRLTPQTREQCLNRVFDQARLRYPHLDDLKDYLDVMRRLLEKEQLRGFFYVEGGEVYTEKEIISENGVTKRIDRLILRRDEVDIIDYKTSRQEGSLHEDQVLEYMDIIRTMYPGFGVKGHLVYLDTFHVEEMKG